MVDIGGNLNAFPSGVQAGAVLSNQIQQSEALAKKDILRQGLYNIYDKNAKAGVSTTLEEVAPLYAQYGDPEDTARITGEIEKNQITKAGNLMQIKINQAAEAYKNHDNKVLEQLNADIKNDPLLSKQFPGAKFMPNNQVSYSLPYDSTVKIGGKEVAVKAFTDILGNYDPETGSIIPYELKDSDYLKILKAQNSGSGSGGGKRLTANQTLNETNRIINGMDAAGTVLKGQGIASSLLTPEQAYGNYLAGKKAIEGLAADADIPAATQLMKQKLIDKLNEDAKDPKKKKAALKILGNLQTNAGNAPTAPKVKGNLYTDPQTGKKYMFLGGDENNSANYKAV